MNDKKRLTLEERKSIPDTCANCNRQFRNVFAAAAHKSHCVGENNTAHLAPYRAWNKGKILASIDDVLREDSPHDTGYVKKIILSQKIKDYRCEGCGLSTWNDKPLVLELDHINGRNSDHRLENLRLLCPNCHSQTENFRGKNVNKDRKTVTDEVLKEALLASKSIRKALIKVGLTPKGGNYARCHKLRNELKDTNPDLVFLE